MANCTNPAAANYDPAAIVSGDCIYLNKVDGTCYEFLDYDADGVLDKSFTLSYAIESNNWTFFHDYVPDYYFHTREKLHLIKGRKIFTANEGPKGEFLGKAAKSFFIDVVFKNDEEQTLNVVKWISEKLTETTDLEFSTLTHLTIWNSYQCTGRIPIAQAFNGLEVTNIRRTKSEWSFNDFRDAVLTRGATFLKDIFNDYAVITAEIGLNIPWYDKSLMEDKYFIIRFEFDNSADNVVLLHDVGVDTTKSNR